MQLAQRMATDEGPALPGLEALHKKLLGQLTKILSSSVTSSRERIVAVAGIGELAAPTRRFFGQQVTKLHPRVYPTTVAFKCDMYAHMHALFLKLAQLC